MASHLDLEEQEQLDQLKHFWSRFGNAITAVLVVACLGVAGWNGYHYWQRSEAIRASALFEEVERAAQAGDAARTEQAFADIRERYGSTVYASQAGLAAAKALHGKGNLDGAKTALSWVAEKSKDAGYQAIAKLRLAGLHVDAKAYDAALQQLAGSFPDAFQSLVADRKGDVLMLQTKNSEAMAEYRRAWTGLDSHSEYRRLIELKLNAQGIDPRASGSESAATAVPAKIKS
jgi:predicted negative regulator of RcsB-dependent stress response